MPPFKNLTDEQLKALTAFLQSQGVRGRNDKAAIECKKCFPQHTYEQGGPTSCGKVRSTARQGTQRKRLLRTRNYLATRRIILRSIGFERPIRDKTQDLKRGLRRHEIY